MTAIELEANVDVETKGITKQWQCTLRQMGRLDMLSH